MICTNNVRSSRLFDLHGSKIEMCRCKVQLSTIQRIVLLVRITVLECLATCTSFLEIGCRVLRRKLKCRVLVLEESHVLFGQRKLLIHVLDLDHVVTIGVLPSLCIVRISCSIEIRPGPLKVNVLTTIHTQVLRHKIVLTAGYA